MDNQNLKEQLRKAEAEQKESEGWCYRTEYRIRCLEANLDRVAMDEFDTIMSQLEVSREALEHFRKARNSAWSRVTALRIQIESQT